MMATIIPITPTNALEYIRTAVAVATFLMSERLPVTIQNIKSYFTKLLKERPEEFDEEDAQELISILVIDKDLLEDLKKNIGGDIKEYRECLKKADTNQERDACDRKVERSLCDTLNRIRNRNKGVLPTGHLRDQWDSFGCVAY